MRWLAGFLLFGALVVAACEIFYTARFPIVVTSRLPGDTLTVYINGQAQRDFLTPGQPSREYRPRLRHEVRDGLAGVEFAVVHVSAYSRDLKRMSRTTTLFVQSDRTEHVEFSPLDFLP